MANDNIGDQHALPGLWTMDLPALPEPLELFPLLVEPDPEEPPNGWDEDRGEWEVYEAQPILKPYPGLHTQDQDFTFTVDPHRDAYLIQVRLRDQSQVIITMTGLLLASIGKDPQRLINAIDIKTRLAWNKAQFVPPTLQVRRYAVA